ncbi:uncharacterized protein FOMMEDRAFT_94263, partial [Fomitiporia mediterranea MF3/22]|uniref:uncharacterized protein n=1 Tax=Fomitiporia mediterranea (strain MF3/22) TaxID=694068 RepID=UPI0004407F21
GESQHRRLKHMYVRTNKQDTVKAVSQLEGRTCKIHEINSCISLNDRSRDPIKSRDLEVHYNMAVSKKDSIHLYQWLSDNDSDPALQNFLPSLCRHLLEHILLRQEDEAFTTDKLYSLHIKNDKLFCLKVLHINYTTYNVRRAQDSLNPWTHADIMLLLDNTEHPYIYTQIIGLFHAEVSYMGPGADPNFQNFNWLNFT